MEWNTTQVLKFLESLFTVWKTDAINRLECFRRLKLSIMFLLLVDHACGERPLTFKLKQTILEKRHKKYDQYISYGFFLHTWKES